VRKLSGELIGIIGLMGRERCEGGEGLRDCLSLKGDRCKCSVGDNSGVAFYASG
jgi:hypothetical protein